MRKLSLVLSFLLLSSAVACGGDETENTDPAKDVTIAFKGLTNYKDFQGTAEIEVDTTEWTTKVELLVDGAVAATAESAPFTISWDTTAAKDGLCKLTLKAYGPGEKTATSADELTVVVINQGQKVSWLDGNTGSVNVPATGYIEEHLKYHWTMPAGVERAVTVMTFGDEDGFELELAIGVGECPDSGTKAASATSKTSPIVVEFGEAGKAIDATGLWFAHVGLKNPNDVLGKKTDFQFTTFLINKQ